MENSNISFSFDKDNCKCYITIDNVNSFEEIEQGVYKLTTSLAPSLNIDYQNLISYVCE